MVVFFLARSERSASRIDFNQVHGMLYLCIPTVSLALFLESESNIIAFYIYKMASQNYPSSFDPEKSFDDMNTIEKIIFRSKQQPLVPLGCLGTCIAVAMAAKGIRTGNTKSANFYFKWRVALQGFTIVALVAGSYYYDAHVKTTKKTDEELAIEKARMREKLWVEELERRDADIKERQRRAELARQYQADLALKQQESDEKK